jgi:adenine-specific DNA-methyltransferase
MSEELANTGSGNLFVIFGEPDIEIREVGAEDAGAASANAGAAAGDGRAAGDGADGAELIQVKINGVDVFHPQSGEVHATGPDGIATWFIDTDYNEESFFIRHAYFLGTGDPYKSLKSTLKDQIDREAWESLYSDLSRPFPKPKSGRIAVKVINHLGDEVMKVFRVG